MPLYPEQELPKLNEYTRDDIKIFGEHFGAGLLGITQEHEVFIEPLWQIAASILENDGPYPKIDADESIRGIILTRVLQALDILVYGSPGERQLRGLAAEQVEAVRLKNDECLHVGAHGVSIIGPDGERQITPLP